MKKLIATIILSAITLTGYADYQFICKDIGYNAIYPQHSTFYKCRLEQYIDFSNWYN